MQLEPNTCLPVLLFLQMSSPINFAMHIHDSFSIIVMSSLLPGIGEFSSCPCRRQGTRTLQESDSSREVGQCVGPFVFRGI